MNKIVLIVMILFTINNSLFAQENTSIFTYNESGEIVTNSRFISLADNSLSSLRFSANNVATTSINETTYVVKTGRFNNWENEPGDFDIIQFYKNNQLILTYKDADGIVKLNNSSNPYANSFNRYSSNGYFIEVALSDTTKIIVFVGQHYGTDLSKIIIFAVTRNEVKLVYNQKVQINSMTKTNNSILMVVQSNIPNENDELITHTIWSDKGVLKFKDS